MGALSVVTVAKINNQRFILEKAATFEDIACIAIECIPDAPKVNEDEA